MRFGAHTHFVTLADTIGTEDCPIPACGRSWIPTLPPVVLDAWSPVATTTDDSFTTVAHWRSYGSIERDGVFYGQKAHSFRSIMGLPRQVDGDFAVALDIHPDETNDLAALTSSGWTLLDPDALCAGPGSYRDFVRSSYGELGVAKSGYVAAHAGWFSDRSACYLAAGRPVIAQSTGFERRLPVGSGLFSFADADDVGSAVDAIRSDPCGQRASARAMAEEHLDAAVVLTRLLERVT
jgi:hypothetical protein